MDELVKIESYGIGAGAVNGVNARDLHAALEVQKDFSDWIKAQILRGRLLENIDYLVFPQKGENPQGGRPSKEYALTIEAAKMIAMMSGAPKGRCVREYFLECERRLNNPAYKEAMRLIEAPVSEIAALLLKEAKAKEALEATVNVLAPKAAALERIAEAPDALCLRDAAKTLGLPEKQYIAWLLQTNVIYRNASGELRGHALKERQGIVTHRLCTIAHTDGKRDKPQVLITKKGLTIHAEAFGARNLNPRHERIL